MIFVTVGTHEQPFNRLVQKIDELKRDGYIQEDVFIQTGYSTYEPQYCQWSHMIPYSEMINNVKNARIVITHGGPASFILPLQEHKIPIIVPRQEKFNEHINDHQMEFVHFIQKKQNNIIIIEDIDDLKETLNHYDLLVSKMNQKIVSHNEIFNLEFEKIIQNLMQTKS